GRQEAPEGSQEEEVGTRFYQWLRARPDWGGVKRLASTSDQPDTTRKKRPARLTGRFYFLARPASRETPQFLTVK
ncbi:MAG: hypothetical protein JW719_10650, partial [Pirellulales bacterium]|nr:hypothetical protein [Pirellulales bacterium]